MFEDLKVDFWTLWGFLAQGLFFFSLIVQWYKSEKKKKSYLPKEFWLIRLVASIMMLVYVFKRKDLVFFVSTILQIGIYLRNIALFNKKQII